MKKFHSEYAKLLEDRQWKEKRRKIILRDKFCQMCGKNGILQVHHIAYLKGFLPWDYPDDFLITLCDRCHKKETQDNILLHEKIKEMQLSGMWSAEIMQKMDINFKF